MTTDDDFTEAARIIDAHRENARWVGDGVKIECVCGHTSHATYDFSGPLTEDKNNHRDAERIHAAHVAQVLAARDTAERQVKAVRELHKRGEVYTRTEECSDPDSHDWSSASHGGDDICLSEPTSEKFCTECAPENTFDCTGFPWPCPTIRALDAEAGRADHAERDDLRAPMAELAPAEVCVRGDWFKVSELPEVLGRMMDARDEAQREAKRYYLRAITPASCKEQS